MAETLQRTSAPESSSGSPSESASAPEGTDRPGPIARVLTLPLELVVLVYQRLISPLTPPTCRFYPSCSSYALTALRRHGPLRGTWLAVRRLLRCHPWNPGGVDHVPSTTR